MKTNTIYIFFISIFVLINLYVNADPLPDSVFLPSASVAVSDDALATKFNPAGLGVSRGFNGYYLRTFSGETGGDNAFFASFSGSGFGAEFVNSGNVKFSKYTLSNGLSLFDNFYLGLGYSWFNSKDKIYDKLSTWDAGVLYRPIRQFSSGFVIKNFNHPTFGDEDIDRVYNLAFAFRPYTNRITFSIDGDFQEGRKIKDGDFTYALECEPIDGLILRGNYDSNGDYGIKFSFNFSQFRLGSYSRFDSEWKHDAGVAYIGFARELQRTKLRTGHYVLEVDSKNLASWRMRNSILYRAKKDKTVDGIILKLGTLGYSMGELQEIRDDIISFRESGKKVICYMELAGNKEYYLATACDKILLNPAGYLSLNGLRSEVTFFKSALDKLGIQADLYNIGKYKSASEMFTRDSISEAYEESLNSILDDLHEQMVSLMAEGRGISKAEVEKKIDEGPYTAKEAMEAGLVDMLVYEDQLKKVKEEIFGKGKLERSGKEYGNQRYYEYNWGSNPKLALIYATGMIAPGKSMGQESDSLISLPEIMGSETMAEAIKSAREDKNVKAIVLRIDSGGGSVFASDVIRRELILAKEKKPLIVSMGGAAASGGYYIASPGDIIIAEPATITGSIGVIAGKFIFHDLYDRIGINKEILKRGKNSDIYTSYKAFTEEQQEIVKRQIQEMYDDFVSKVAQDRDMTEDEVELVAQGRVWTGRQAKERKLADEMGGLPLALSLARAKAGLKPDENLDVVILPKREPLWRQLIYQDSSFSFRPSNLIYAVNVKKFLERLTDERIFVIMPYDLDFE